jgi:ABC-2 type transport system ATP-binding protein
MAAIIEARTVSKRFRQHKRFPGLLGAIKTLFTSEFTEVVAVADVSFAIAEGEAVGYLGPNGAGKSTMIKMLTGILVPTSGAVSVLGRTPHQERMTNAREIGVVFGQRSQLWWDLPVIDSFQLHRRIYDIPDDRFAENLSYLSGLLELAPFSTGRCGSSAWASACGPRSSWRCCTIPGSSSSTNPPSASMSSPRTPSASSSAG